MGFQYIPALFMPQLCIVKRRALAIAITLSGFPLGSFIHCPIFQFLINSYGWTAAILITGAVILNGCAIGIILVPPKTSPKQKSLEEVRKQKDMGSVMLYSKERINDPTLVSADMKTYETILTKLKTVFDVSIFKSSLMCAVFLTWM